jgi:hypothetical protein
MNDSELDAKLKAAREPLLPADYCDDFPRLVLAGLRSAPLRQPPPKQVWILRLAWGFATVVCVLITFAVGHRRGNTETKAVNDVLTNPRLVQETLALFPNRVRAIVQDEHGMNLILSDQDNVPRSTPIYVRVCDGKNCSSMVTFSGQEIQIAGQKLTVLSQTDGGIILEGNQFLWSAGKKLYVGKNLEIEAKNLGPLAM